MKRNVAFTPAALDAVNKGKISDPRTPGLLLEVLPSGKKVWKYSRRLYHDFRFLRLTFGPYPARTMAEAREWAAALNRNVDIGIDPREAMRAEQLRNSMTVARAHELYMAAVREGRASRAKRRNKPRTIADKIEMYRREIAPAFERRSIYEVTEGDLIRLVRAKGRTAPVRANRLAAELKVFFGWASGLRGSQVGLEIDPARRLSDLKFPEVPRDRKLSLQEIGWFLRAVAEEDPDLRRGMLLWLLTGARISEVVQARSVEIVESIWTIPAKRSKNSAPHRIALGPWGQSLMAAEGEWLFPAPRSSAAARNNSVWYKARDRVLLRMSKLAGRPIERFTPHDLRRTVRSNTKRLGVDFETAEAMMNHLKKGLERIYDGYELEDEKAAGFLTWEREVARIAQEVGAADALGVPSST